VDGALEEPVEEGPGEPGGGVMCVQTEQRTRALFTLRRSARSKAMVDAACAVDCRDVEVEVERGSRGGTEK
jgi:hypothetical protein